LREGRAMTRGGVMVTVGGDAAAVERRLVGGQLSCPGCLGVLTGWGHARERSVRGLDGSVRLRSRRARCCGCGGAHVLLAVALLLRRADTAAVIGSALSTKAGGVGHRRVAAGLGRAAETVRGWLRRFAGRVEAVRAVFTVLLRAVAADPVMPESAGGAWADALAAIGAAATAAAGPVAGVSGPPRGGGGAGCAGRVGGP